MGYSGINATQFSCGTIVAASLLGSTELNIFCFVFYQERTEDREVTEGTGEVAGTEAMLEIRLT
jgi:hypothetical protein